jgi:threonine dehydratase
MTASPVPDLADVLAARQRIAPYLRTTALYRYPALDAMTGAQVWVKHENHQPVGAFKVRGGVNLVSQLGADERRRGVIAASTGNHGQSVAYAADLFGVRAVICVPEQANGGYRVSATQDTGPVRGWGWRGVQTRSGSRWRVSTAPSRSM